MFKFLLLALMLASFQAKAATAWDCLKPEPGFEGASWNLHNICNQTVHAAYCLSSSRTVCTTLTDRITLGPGQSYRVGLFADSVPSHNGCFGEIQKVVGLDIVCKGGR